MDHEHKTNVPTLEDIIQAYNNIKKYINQTPILTSETINEMAGCDIIFKCENFQKSSTFKFLGATNIVTSLTSEQREKGLCAYSTGNHAGSVAKLAKMFGIKAYLVLPKAAPQLKKDYIRSLGGEIIDAENNMDSILQNMREVIEKTGATYIPTCNDYKLFEATGTISYQIYSQYQDLDFMVCPIGGGSLITGLTLGTQYLSPNTKVVGAEAYLSAKTYVSLKKGKLQAVPLLTIADGLRINLGSKSFDILQENNTEVLLATEQEIIEATNLVLKTMKIVVETSSATALAVILKNKDKFRGKKVAVVFSGGNLNVSANYQEQIEKNQAEEQQVIEAYQQFA